MYFADVLVILLQIFFLAREIRSGEGSEWMYTGPTGSDNWPSLAPACGYSGQSPINIDTKSLLPDARLGLLQLDGYQQNLSGGQFSNNGHTVQLTFPGNKLFQLHGPGINGTYKALQLHFHWAGSNSTIGGSEHTVNGEHYDAEMHIVHIKNPLAMKDAKDLKDGLAVLGVFLKAEPGASDNPHFQMLLKVAQSAHYRGETVDLVKGPTLISLLPSTGSYYRYYGSLTTPPCFEAVLWTIYHQPVIISQRQLQIFQTFKVGYPEPDSQPIFTNSSDIDNIKNPTVHNVKEEDELSDNYRPTQAMNGRVVTAYYDIDVVEKDKEADSTWHYDGDKGPAHWSKDNKNCKGRKQSPIDVKTNSTLSSDELRKLKFSSSYLKETSGELLNNGHTVKYSLSDEYKIEFWEAETKYKAIQVHFHWGRAIANGKTMTSSGGSEHTVDGKHFPIEMHIVHAKVASDDDDSHEDDLAVLGVFFELQNEKHQQDDKSSKALEEITGLFDKVHYHDEETEVEEGPALFDLFPSNQSYYRYMGSLTTPPCTESVMWTIFTHPVYVAKERFLEFQSLFKVKKSDVIPLNSTDKVVGTSEADTQTTLEKTLMQGNFRPTQEYYSRTVVVFVDKDVVVVATETNVMEIVLWTVGGLAVFVAILALMICCGIKGGKTKDTTAYKQVGTKPPHSAVESV